MTLRLTRTALKHDARQKCKVNARKKCDKFYGSNFKIVDLDHAADGRAWKFGQSATHPINGRRAAEAPADRAFRAPRSCAASRNPRAETGHGRQHPPAGLAARAVVGLVLGISDALNRRAAHSGKAVRSGHAPPFPDEMRSPSPEMPPQLPAQQFGPAHASVVDRRSNRRSTSGCRAFAVRAVGDRPAACRISSEYALPMPANRRGSVRARFSVWFCRVSTAAKVARSISSGSTPPRSNAGEPRLARDQMQRRPTLRARLRQDQRSVGKSSASSAFAASYVASGARQCSRPAIIR